MDMSMESQPQNLEFRNTPENNSGILLKTSTHKIITQPLLLQNQPSCTFLFTTTSERKTV